MSDFKAKMHQIVCWLGLCPQTPPGEFTALPQTPSWILRGLLLRGGEGTRGEGREGTGG